MIATIASRELRNDAAAVLRQVEAGARFLVTLNGRTVAELRPVTHRRPTIGWAEFERMLAGRADPQLATLLADEFSETTDDLP